MKETSMDETEATYFPDSAFFAKALELADKVGGELGLTVSGRLVIVLAQDNADNVVDTATNDDWPYGLLEAPQPDVITFRQ